jgi:hypothetical protein
VPWALAYAEEEQYVQMEREQGMIRGANEVCHPFLLPNLRRSPLVGFLCFFAKGMSFELLTFSFFLCQMLTPGATTGDDKTAGQAPL